MIVRLPLCVWMIVEWWLMWRIDVCGMVIFHRMRMKVCRCGWRMWIDVRIGERKVKE